MRRYPVLLARYGAAAALALATLLPLSGCTPKIGDACTQSTDCSVQGNRACDTSQIGGYCTIFGCATNSCPDSASCVVFRVSVPGCQYNDYDAPGRTGRSLCMEGCKGDSDCRGGYVCRDPRGAPWSAVILDDTQQDVCIQAPVNEGNAGLNPDAAVCTGSVPFTAGDGGDGSAPEGATPDASRIAASDGAMDVGSADAPGGG